MIISCTLQHLRSNIVAAYNIRFNYIKINFPRSHQPLNKLCRLQQNYECSSLGIKHWLQAITVRSYGTQNKLKNFDGICFSRTFRTSPRRHLHPLILIIAKPIFKVAAILSGRGVRKWWKDLPHNKRKYFFNSLKRNKIKIGVILGAMGCLSFLYYESHIQETPVTKRKRFIAFTSEQSKQIADFEFQLQMEIFKKEMLPANHPSCQRVAEVALRLLTANKDLEQIYGKEWMITVIDSPVENAFVLPNGQIFVFTGMLKLCENNDQLGAILAHEMAHCVLGHGAEQVSFAHLIDIVIIVVIAAIWAILPSDAVAVVSQWLFHKVVQVLVDLPYNRMLETEADEVGIQLAAKACFDVRESSAFWSKMAFLSNLKNTLPDIEWLSTHPSHEKRSGYLDTLMDKAIELRQTCGCPSLQRKDPRLDVDMFKKAVQELLKKQSQRTHKQLVTILVPGGIPPGQ